MEDSRNAIPPYSGQTWGPNNNGSLTAEEVRIDRDTLTRRLSGNSLLDYCARSNTPLPMKGQRKRSASTSTCLPGKGGRWVSVPSAHGQKPTTTNSESLSQSLVDEAAFHMSYSPEKMSSFSSTDAHRSTSMSTCSASSVLPTPTLSPASDHGHEPKHSMRQLRRKSRNPALHDTLIQAQGCDRVVRPGIRRLSLSLPLSATTTAPYLTRRRPRRHSTSVYQPSPRAAQAIRPTTSSYRISPILGPITLSSPSNPQALCLAAIAHLNQTQDTLAESWSQCCKARHSLPSLHTLWPALHSLNNALRLFPAAAHTATPPPTAADKQPASAHHHHHHQRGLVRNPHRLIPTSQLARLARDVFAASDMLWPLIKALNALAPQQLALVVAQVCAPWARHEALTRAVAVGVRECERIVRCPLVPWLWNARLGVCEALGVVAGEEDGLGEEGIWDVVMSGALGEEEEEEEEEEEKEDVGDGDGNNVETVVERGNVPRCLRLRIGALKARYHGLCLLPARLCCDKLGELATQATRTLQQLKEAHVGDAALHAELRALRRNIRGRLAKMQKQKPPERLGLLDSATRKMASPALPFQRRFVSGLKAGWAKIRGEDFLDDLDELFQAWEENAEEGFSWEEDSSWEQTTEEEEPLERQRLGDRNAWSGWNCATRVMFMKGYVWLGGLRLLEPRVTARSSNN